MARRLEREYHMRTRTCRRCERTTARRSGLCRECEREEQRQSTDAQRGFSIDWGEFVPFPRMSELRRARDDGAGGTVQE